MKKRLSLLLAILMAALFVLSAVPAMAEKTVITYWSNDRHDEVYMNEMIEKFNASHDDIEINMVIMTDDFENSILLAIDGRPGHHRPVRHPGEYGGLRCSGGPDPLYSGG